MRIFSDDDSYEERCLGEFEWARQDTNGWLSAEVEPIIHSPTVKRQCAAVQNPRISNRNLGAAMISSDQV